MSKGYPFFACGNPAFGGGEDDKHIASIEGRRRIGRDQSVAA
jgi:hypothetical protein